MIITARKQTKGISFPFFQVPLAAVILSNPAGNPNQSSNKTGKDIICNVVAFAKGTLL
jgi:hypothetical protein